ncbi:hypothetical protein [Candidatus Mycolicibacterium alkanivorans]|uniref:Transmembrane protein n=1 Tax=Candidatus Mycolicibacterium alkanivorans TaxID=2954114 RepID=A0ABS9YRP6_9MYCO|nr:hypothetical protein [Candidatus Mycolicibacterium alkanivorans]MCI4673847.1 hypothetical protein [Candidatus Mycolicibacterium alkanivorans]
MRNLARVLVFDVAAPLAAIAALLAIGVVLGWPLWWVSVCSMLCLLIVEGMVVNFVVYRRDSVTVGTDDDGPGLRLAVVGLATVALAVAVVVGYTRWTLPDRDFTRDSAEVVRIATAVSEATATFTPADPMSSIDRAAAFMAPERADSFKNEFGKATADLAKRNVSAQAQTISAGLEALGPSAASVAVIIRGTQSQPGQPPNTAVLALRVGLTKQDGQWLVLDVAPINSR